MKNFFIFLIVLWGVAALTYLGVIVFVAFHFISKLW